MSFTRIIAIVAVLVLVVILYLVGIFNPSIAWVEIKQNAILYFFTESRWSLAEFSAGFKDRLTLGQENRSLRQERDELLAKNVGLDIVQRENEFLRAQLKYEPPRG